MSHWTDDLESCFDNLDRFFASHAMDEKRAFKLLGRLRKDGIGWCDLSNAVRTLLQSDGCSPQHIELQVAQVEYRFRPWLPD